MGLRFNLLITVRKVDMLIRDVLFRTENVALQKCGIKPTSRHFTCSDHYRSARRHNLTIRGAWQVTCTNTVNGECCIRENNNFIIMNTLIFNCIIHTFYWTGGLLLEVFICLVNMGVEPPFLITRSPSRSLGSGDIQSGRRPVSANISLVTALSNTEVSNVPNIEPWRLLHNYNLDIIFYLPPSHCV